MSLPLAVQQIVDLVTEERIMRNRKLYHDEDYAYDYTNPPSDRSRWHQEKVARTKTCPGFESSDTWADICKHCFAPQTAHADTAKKAS